jgi:hypothetical protein
MPITVFVRSNAGIVGSNPTWDMDMCAFIVFMLSCVEVAALKRADLSSKESYRLSNWNSEQGHVSAITKRLQTRILLFIKKPDDGRKWPKHVEQ